jgi:hypothetical protein
MYEGLCHTIDIGDARREPFVHSHCLVWPITPSQTPKRNFSALIVLPHPSTTDYEAGAWRSASP